MKIDAFEKIINNFTFQEGMLGREEFFNSVVMVLIIPVDGDYHFVFQKRSTKIRQGGEVSFPGGRVDETDESLVQAALRETTEEMGISADKIRIIGRLHTMLTPSGIAVDAFIGIADISTEEIRINEHEVESFFTIPIAYFMDHDPAKYNTKVTIQPSYQNEQGEEVVLFPARELGLPERYWKAWGSFNHEILVYQTEQGIIWGITARFLYEFVKLIRL